MTDIELVKALREARMMVAEWGEYASPYFQEKWDLAGDLAKLDSVIAEAAKGAGLPIGGDEWHAHDGLGIHPKPQVHEADETEAERRFADQKITP